VVAGEEGGEMLYRLKGINYFMTTSMLSLGLDYVCTSWTAAGTLVAQRTSKRLFSLSLAKDSVWDTAQAGLSRQAGPA
jgi:hypothetical protein